MNLDTRDTVKKKYSLDRHIMNQSEMCKYNSMRVSENANKIK